MPRQQTFRITNVETQDSSVIDLDFDRRDLSGWNSLVSGWSVGAMGSGTAIELDEPLEGAQIGIFPASNHVLLWGQAPSAMPDIYCLNPPGSWVKLTSEVLRRHAEPGGIRLRFDRRPIRIGKFIIEMLG